MNCDRRESLRRAVRLPFQWQTIDQPMAPETLSKLFDLPFRVRLAPRFAELENGYLHAIRQVREPGAAAALDVLNERLSALQDALFAEDPQPPERPLELSDSGVAFACQAPLEAAQWLALHLVLPICHHVLCNARVLRCEGRPGVNGFRLVARLHEPAAADARCLTRYLVGNA